MDFDMVRKTLTEQLDALATKVESRLQENDRGSVCDERVRKAFLLADQNWCDVQALLLSEQQSLSRIRLESA